MQHSDRLGQSTPIDPIRLLDFIDRRIRTGLPPDHVLAEVRRYVELFAEGEPAPPLTPEQRRLRSAPEHSEEGWSR